MKTEKSATALLVETCAQIPQYTIMSGLLFWLPVVKMSWEKNSKKKPILLVNFCFLIHFDFSNTRIFSFSVGIKVMNPKMPLCQHMYPMCLHLCEPPFFPIIPLNGYLIKGFAIFLKRTFFGTPCRFSIPVDRCGFVEHVNEELSFIDIDLFSMLKA